MKKKTRKKQRNLEEALKTLLFLGAIGSYLLTKDIYLTITLVFLVIFIIIGIALLHSLREREKLRKSGIHEIDKMDGIQFEYYLKELYKSQGYSVEVTKSTGDFGADLILKKDGQKIVVQAKRYSKSVGIKAVQEIIAAKRYYNGTDAWVVTNSDFTNAAIELANKSNVSLIGRNKLVENIINMNPNAIPNTEKIKQEVELTYIKCDRCGGNMIIRNGKKGQFYGCSNFPKCRNTKNVG